MARFIRRSGEFLIRQRILILLILVAVTVFLCWHIKYFKLVNDPDTFSAPNHPFMRFNRWAEKNFGMGNVAIVAIKLKEGGKYKTVYNPVTLTKLWNLVKAYEQLPHAWKSNFMSLATKKIRYVKGVNGWLKVMRMMKDPEVYPMKEQVAHVKEGVKLSRLYHNFMASDNEKYLFIIMDFHDSVKDDYLKVWKQMHELARKIVIDDDHDVLFSGEVPLCAWMIEQVRERAYLLIPCFVIIFAILWFDLGTFRGALAPFLGNSLSFFWTMGFMGLLHFPLTTIAPAILLLILAVGNSHSMQLAKRYFELIGEGNDREKAGIRVIEQLAPASLSSIFTDMIGFSLLALFPVKVYTEYSIFGTFGMLTFIPLCFIMVPLCLTAFISDDLARKIAAGAQAPGVLEKWAEGLSRFIMGKGKWIVLGATGCLIAVCVALTPYTIVGANLRDAGVKPESQLARWDDQIKEVLGTTPFSLSVVGKGHKRDTLKDPALLKAMVKFEEWFRSLPLSTYVISIADFLENLNYHIWEMEPDQYRIPDTQGQVADLLFAYRSGGDPSDFDTVVSLHSEQGLMIGFYNTFDPRELRQFRKLLDAKVHELFDPFKDKVDVKYMGSFMGTILSLYDVTDEYRWNFWIPFVVAVFLAMVFILRSITASFIIVIALGVIIVFQYGLMGFYSLLDNPLWKWGGNMTFYTLMMFGMVVGIGVDYSIYMTQRLRREFTDTGHLQETLRRCYAGTGSATFVTFVTMCAILVPMMFTPLTNLFCTAIILIPDFIVAFFSATVLVPALYAVFKPKAITLKDKI